MEETKYLERKALPGRVICTFSFITMLLVLNTHRSSAQTAVASNSGPVCTGGTVMLYETGGSAVSWLWSSSGAAVFNDRTLQNPVATGAVNGEVFTVQITDAGGSTASSTTTVTVYSAAPVRPGQVSGNETPCANTSGLVYTITPVVNATSYLWEVPVGAEITAGQGKTSITVNLGPDAPATGTIRVFAVNACGTSTPARSKNLNVTQLPVAAGPITGSPTYIPGTAGSPYSVASITGATSYIWSYSGTGVTINGNGTSGVTLDFSSGATAGQLTVRGINTCGEGSASSLDLGPSAKTLTLSSVFLEGLYSGGGTMRQAAGSSGAQWPAGIADHITVELRNSASYSTVVYSDNGVELTTSGTVLLTIPSEYTDSYYITVKSRNHIETTTASTVSFNTPAVEYIFDNQSKAFGGNLKFVDEATDHFVIYGGDSNNDGVTDGLDMIGVENGAMHFSSGYLQIDVNGDGIVDGLDLILVENNALRFVRAIVPL